MTATGHTAEQENPMTQTADDEATIDEAIRDETTWLGALRQFGRRFGRRIEAARGDIHQPLTDAAIQMDCSAGTLRQVERGEWTTLKMGTLAGIAAWAERHGVRIDWLLLGRGPMRVAETDPSADAEVALRTFAKLVAAELRRHDPTGEPHDADRR